MKNLLITFGTLLAASIAPSVVAMEPVKAEKPTHVVELFTSQGCSSCPPANRFVTKLADDPSMLVLTYGVTYWDYLGWTDTFGDPEFTKRQREYRDAFGAPNIYTPQIVLGGVDHSSRYSKKDVAAATLPDTGVGLSFTLKWENQSASLLMPEAEGMQYAALVHDRKTAKILDAAVLD